jgi:hypothetical protein
MITRDSGLRTGVLAVLHSTVWVVLLSVVFLPGSSRADTATWTQALLSDYPAFFKAEGTLVTVDDDGGGVFGPSVIVGGNYWQWLICHQASGWTIGGPPGVPGAANARLWSQGTHIDGPHPEDQDPNYLPSCVTSAVNIPFGKSKLVQIARRDPHPAGANRHYDNWGVGSKLTANPGGPPSLSGRVRIYAQHNGVSLGGIRWLDWITFGSDVTYSTVSFNPGTGVLQVFVGPVNILNRVGSTGGGIDPWYMGDPVLGSFLWMSEMQYIGPEP